MPNTKRREFIQRALTGVVLAAPIVIPVESSAATEQPDRPTETSKPNSKSLTYGQKWAIYLLLAEHAGMRGTKSQFRRTIEDYVKNHKLPLRDAVEKAAREQIDPNIEVGSIGPLQSLAAEDLRAALLFDGGVYDPNMGPCPDGPAAPPPGGGPPPPVQSEKLDHQTPIVRALLSMTGPLVIR